MAKNSSVLGSAFRQFEALTTSIRMFAKMSLFIVLFLIALHLFFSTALSIRKIKTQYSDNDVGLLIVGTKLKFQTMIPIYKSEVIASATYNQKQYSMSAYQFESRYEKYYIYLIEQFKSIWINSLIFTSPIYLLYIIIMLVLGRIYKKETGEKYIRGRNIVDESEYYKHLDKKDDGFKIKINRTVHIPENILTRHNFCIGKPGVGKSQLAYLIVTQLIEANRRCVIHDFKGDFVPFFYDSNKHLIFNPFDKRHLRWTIFNDIHDALDIESFAYSIVPDNPSVKDPFWINGPRNVLVAGIRACIYHKWTTNNQLIELFKKNHRQLRKIFKETPGCEMGTIVLQDDKVAAQLTMILSTYFAPLYYLQDTDGDFSFKEWIDNDETDKRIIYISNTAKVQSTLAKLISGVFDIIVKNACSLDDSYTRKIHILLDEFGQLSQVGAVKQLLTQGRSKGLCGWIFIQDTAQMSSIYTKEGMDTIVNSCGNKYYFAVGNYDTANYISQELGTIEIERSRESKSFGISDLKDTISVQNEILEKKIALPAELLQLKSLTMYMSLTDLPLTHASFGYAKYPSSGPAIDFRNLDYLLGYTHDAEEKSFLEGLTSMEEVEENEANEEDIEQTQPTKEELHVVSEEEYNLYFKSSALKSTSKPEFAAKETGFALSENQISSKKPIEEDAQQSIGENLTTSNSIDLPEIAEIPDEEIPLPPQNVVFTDDALEEDLAFDIPTDDTSLGKPVVSQGSTDDEEDSGSSTDGDSDSKYLFT